MILDYPGIYLEKNYGMRRIDKMKNVLILGSTGMLGSMCLDYLSKQEDICLSATNRSSTEDQDKKYPNVIFHYLDVFTDFEDLPIAHQVENYDYIINCIGMIKPYIKPEKSQTISDAIKLNALFPHTLANMLKGTETRLIQICTDCVYSGEDGNYDEESSYSATDVYGMSKCLGEVDEKGIINLRASIIGPEYNKRKSLLDKIKYDIAEDVWFGYTDHFWNGITTLSFAKICHGIIKSNFVLSDDMHFQHIVPANIMNKHDLIKCIIDTYKLDVQVFNYDSYQNRDMTLGTLYKMTNTFLWIEASYKEIPTIEFLINELKEYEMEMKK